TFERRRTMRRCEILAVRMGALTLLLLLFVHGSDAIAQHAKPDAKLQQKEDEGRVRASGELASVARFASSVNAIHEARAIYSTSITLAPRDEKVRKELSELEKRKKKDAPTKDGLAQISDRKTKALAKAAEILTPVVAAYADADRSDEMARL